MKPTIQIIRNHRKPKISDESNKDLRTLELRVTYKRKSRYYSANGTIQLSAEEFKNKHLKKYKDAFEETLPAYNSALEIVGKLGDSFCFDLFYRDYKKIIRGEIYSAYDMQSIFDEYISDTGRSRQLSDKTVLSYRNALNWLLKFKKNLTIDEITAETISNLHVFLHKHNPNISQNTVNIYFRSIKAVYNYAVEKGYVTDRRPFAKYPLTSTRKVNYGLSVKSLQQILAYSSPDDKAQFGRDMFILSFELNGHYLSDILRLKNKNISQSEEGWVLQFIRHKTKRHAIPVTLFITDEAMRIIKKYGSVDLTRPNDYIFPFLHNAPTERQIIDRINDINYRANIGLRIITCELGLPHITMAQARHTYASLQCEYGRSLLDIQMDMGHANSNTTQGYINSLRVSSMKRSKAIKEQLHGTII